MEQSVEDPYGRAMDDSHVAGSPGVDHRVVDHYVAVEEDARLWRPGTGELVRLRTWDIFARHLPGGGRLLDIGGGPGTHAAHLAGLGYDVTLIDPIAGHVARATRRAETGRWFGAEVGDALDLPADDGSVDVVLLMGPLYHLRDPADRARALAEAHRVLRPGGTLLAEVISRYAWLLDATNQDLLDDEGIFEDFTVNITSGDNVADHRFNPGGFWAYLHHPDELADELRAGGFDDVGLVAVEGFGWLLGDLAERMQRPEPLLRAIRLTETEPSLLSCSAHVIGVGRRPARDPA